MLFYYIQGNASKLKSVVIDGMNQVQQKEIRLKNAGVLHFPQVDVRPEDVPPKVF